MKLKRKINLEKKPQKIKRTGIKIDMKNKIKIDCRVELKRIITFPKRVKKKIEIKTTMTKLKSIIPSI